MKRNILLCVTLLTALPNAQAGKDERALAHNSPSSWCKKALAVGLGTLHILGSGQSAQAQPCEQIDGVSLCYPTTNYLLNAQLPSGSFLKQICWENSTTQDGLECQSCDDILNVALSIINIGQTNFDTYVCTKPEDRSALGDCRCDGPAFTIDRRVNRLYFNCKTHHHGNIPVLPIPWNLHVWQCNAPIKAALLELSKLGLITVGIIGILKNIVGGAPQ